MQPAAPGSGLGEPFGGSAGDGDGAGSPGPSRPFPQSVAFCGFCEVIPQDPFLTRKRSLFGGSRAGGKLQAQAQSQAQLQAQAQAQAHKRTRSDALPYRGPSGPSSSPHVPAQSQAQGQPYAGLRKSSAPPLQGSSSAALAPPEQQRDATAQQGFSGGAALSAAVSGPASSSRASSSREGAGAGLSASAAPLDMRLSASPIEAPVPGLLRAWSPKPPSASGAAPLKSCLRRSPADTASERAREQQQAQAKAASSSDWHALTVCNTRSAALLQSSACELGLAGSADSSPVRARSSGPPSPELERGGTGPRVVAPRAVMKALSFGGGPAPAPAAEGEAAPQPQPLASPVGSPPKAAGAPPTSPARARARQASGSAPHPRPRTEGPPIITPDDGAVPLDELVQAPPPVQAPAMPPLERRRSPLPPSPVQPTSPTTDAPNPAAKPHRRSLLGRSSDRLLLKLNVLRLPAEDSGASPSSASAEEPGSALAPDALAEGGLVPLNAKCSCLDCTARLLRGLSDGYVPPFSRGARAKWARDRQAALILAEQNIDAQERLARREAILKARMHSPDMANVAGGEILRMASPGGLPRAGGPAAPAAALSPPALHTLLPQPRADARPAFALNDDEEDEDDSRSSDPDADAAQSPAAELPNPFSIAPGRVKADELHMCRTDTPPTDPDSSASPAPPEKGTTPSPQPPAAAAVAAGAGAKRCPSPHVPYRALSPEACAYLPRSLTPQYQQADGGEPANDVDAALRASIEAELRRKEERARRKAKGQCGGARAMLLMLDEADARERQACTERERLRKENASPFGHSRSGTDTTAAAGSNAPSRAVSPPPRLLSPALPARGPSPKLSRGPTPPAPVPAPPRNPSPFSAGHTRASLSQSAAHFVQQRLSAAPSPAPSATAAAAAAPKSGRTPPMSASSSLAPSPAPAPAPSSAAPTPPPPPPNPPPKAQRPPSASSASSTHQRVASAGAGAEKPQPQARPSSAHARGASASSAAYFSSQAQQQAQQPPGFSGLGLTMSNGSGSGRSGRHGKYASASSDSRSSAEQRVVSPQPPPPPSSSSAAAAAAHSGKSYGLKGLLSRRRSAKQ